MTGKREGENIQMKAVILESLGVSAEVMRKYEEKFEAQGVTFAEYARTADQEQLIAEAKDADVMIVANMPVPEAVVRACGHLKFIDVAFTGVDHIPLAVAKEKGIAVSNASGYSTEAVSELVLGMALSMARNLRAVEDRCRAGKTKDGLIGWEIRGKTVGIIGLGKIGTRTAELFHAFGADILAHSRSVHPDAPDYIRQTTLEEVLRLSDIVVLHCPLNDSTRGMINAERLSMMKPSALLINAARGPVVKEQDLLDALEGGKIAGAALDVFDKEPPLDPALPVLRTASTLLTPHVAFATQESMLLRAQIVFDNLENWLNGTQINRVI